MSLPGGGAEILSARVRKKISPKKGGPETWLDVHRVAHEVGLRSTATMMYGHVETAEDILEHLESIRALQDKALAEGNAGFTAFVPWSYKRDNTPLRKWVARNAGPAKYLRILAASRLILDNFDHIQATWFSEGKKTGQVSLQFGADDFGGTLFEENVHKATGHVNMTTVEETAHADPRGRLRARAADHAVRDPAGAFGGGDGVGSRAGAWPLVPGEPGGRGWATAQSTCAGAG